LNEPPETRYQVCWQSPLFYNISLDQRWFFTRTMGILRSYFMIGFLIGGNINTMSIYSMSLGLLVKSQFFHPRFQMDDIIFTLSAMKATGVRIQIRTLDIPTLSGPTSGNDVMSELNEWVVQATRWTIGAAEVFHYFFVKLLKLRYFWPGLAYFWWFVYYYGFVLCASGLIGISNLIVQLVGLAHEELSIHHCKPCQSWFNLSDDSAFYTWIMPSFLLFNYAIVFTTAFIMDSLVSQILALDETIHPIRNFFHWLTCQPVLWFYCLVEYKAIFQIAYYGKEACGHKPSQKHALVGSKALHEDDVKEFQQESPPQSSEKKSGGDRSRAFAENVYESFESSVTSSLPEAYRSDGKRMSAVASDDEGTVDSAEAAVKRTEKHEDASAAAAVTSVQNSDRKHSKSVLDDSVQLVGVSMSFDELMKSSTFKDVEEMHFL
jgi:hypothetical protein